MLFVVIISVCGLAWWSLQLPTDNQNRGSEDEEEKEDGGVQQVQGEAKDQKLKYEFIEMRKLKLKFLVGWFLLIGFNLQQFHVLEFKIEKVSTF